ncbi:MAG TPA: LysM peptidoglycan-binding domain-containing protein, partial [bacterium]|nr:LysM peptidoglycan-binding domain-containing protein [bacterium]
SQIRIAAMYSVSIQELKDWNGIKNDAVVVNQKLKLKIPAHTKIQYPVRSGDNLLKIAEQFKVKAERIKEWNKRELNGLQAGEVLTIYIGKN